MTSGTFPSKDGDTLVGVLTDRDLKRALDPDLGLPPKEELFVEDAFVPGAYVIDEAVALDVVLETMSEQHIGSALVTRAGKLVGIVTAMDACRLLCEQLRSRDDEHVTRRSGLSRSRPSPCARDIPDKICDFVADSILDAYLATDPRSRVACEALVKSGTLVVAGEITSNGEVDREAVVRQAIRELGYTDPTEPFDAKR